MGNGCQEHTFKEGQVMQSFLEKHFYKDLKSTLNIRF